MGDESEFPGTADADFNRGHRERKRGVVIRRLLPRLVSDEHDARCVGPAQCQGIVQALGVQKVGRCRRRGDRWSGGCSRSATDSRVVAVSCWWQAVLPTRERAA